MEVDVLIVCLTWHVNLQACNAEQSVLALQDLNDSMQSHLRLHFNNEEASDEQVCLWLFRLPLL